MKKVFILFVSLVFVAAMTACQPAAVPADAADTPDTAEPADTVDSDPTEETAETAAAGGSYKLTLDVNPSIELTVQDGVVTGAAAYNDDGQAILLGASVTGLSAEGAIDAIIAEIAAAGYLGAADKEPYVLLTVAGGAEDPELFEELEEYTEEALEGAGVDGEVKSAAVSGETAAGAAAQGMSAGRYMILQYIAQEKGITFEEAVAQYGAMSIGQLMEQFDDLDEAFDEDGVEDIEDIEDEDDDEDAEDIEDGDEDSEDDEDAEDVEDDEDENDDEDEDSGQDDDQDDDENDDEHSGGDEGGDED